MNNRIKQIRKSLNIDQQTFGNLIGLAPTTISSIETGYRQLSDRNINIICDTFNVNPNWLRTGEGKMFLSTDASLLDSLQKKYNLSLTERELVERYISLSPSDREKFTSILLSLVPHSD